MSLPAWLPSLVSVNGDWNERVVELHTIFARDFAAVRFRGMPVWWDRRCLDGSPHCEAFWHLITKEDRASQTRFPDFPRAERIAWCAAIIANCDGGDVVVFDYMEKGHRRTYLWCKSAAHVVILEVQVVRSGPLTGKRVARFITAYDLGAGGQRNIGRRYEQREP